TLLDEVTGELGPAISQARATLRVSGDLPVVQGDPTLLRQLLQNLVENALKFRRGEAVRIDVLAERERGECVVGVRDDGIGIDLTHLGEQNLFNLFERLHTESEYSGSGIGLAICKKIVELH